MLHNPTAIFIHYLAQLNVIVEKTVVWSIASRGMQAYRSAKATLTATINIRPVFHLFKSRVVTHSAF